MAFHPRIQKLSSKVITELIDEHIEVCNNAANKSAFRAKLINQRLKRAKEYSVLSSTDINHTIKILSDKSNSPFCLCRAMKDMSKKLNDYYTILINIFESLR